MMTHCVRAVNKHRCLLIGLTKSECSRITSWGAGEAAQGVKKKQIRGEGWITENVTWVNGSRKQQRTGGGYLRVKQIKKINNGAPCM